MPKQFSKHLVVNNTELKSLLYRLWIHFSLRRRRQFFLVSAMAFISAFAEIVSLGAVLPFLGILIAPEKVFQQPIIHDFALSLGILSSSQLIAPITITFALVTLMAGIVRIIQLWANIKLAFAGGADLGIEMYRRTLYQPYQVHVARNSSEVISNSAKINTIIFGIISPVLTLTSSTILLISITIALFVIDTFVASVAILGFGGCYGFIAFLAKKKLQFYSQVMSQESTKLIKAQQEGLGGIRDILLDGTQIVYCNIYKQANYTLRQALGNTIFIGLCPRYITEAFGMLFIIGLAFFLSTQQGGVATAFPILGALALGAQRLLPALQQTYSTWASIVSTRESLVDVLEMLDQPLPENLSNQLPLISFQNQIRFDGVRFRYSNDTPWVIDGLDLTIPKGSRFGFVGSTGSGKSTTLDLLMGLLIPNEGRLLLDGIPVTGDRIRAWQKTIAHVPQNIFLADASIAENIAFGIPYPEIDLQQVKVAAAQAQIADFIESRPEGYTALIGERGVRLSGGQRQRIGIARALYKQANVLIFDEATSALDANTEASVMNAIQALNRDMTILIIAHRLTTIKHCDSIIELENGKIVAQGSFEHLLKCSSSFRQMAQVA